MLLDPASRWEHTADLSQLNINPLARHVIEYLNFYVGSLFLEYLLRLLTRG